MANVSMWDDEEEGQPGAKPGNFPTNRKGIATSRRRLPFTPPKGNSTGVSTNDKNARTAALKKRLAGLRNTNNQ